MGLEGISEFIKKRHTGCITNSHLSEFAFKRIVVDISGFIYRYMSIYGKDNTQWLRCFVNLILLMRSNNVIFIPVFDGKPPKEKCEEIQERRKARDNITDKVKSIEDDMETYITEGKISDKIKDILNKASPVPGTDNKKSLLHSIHQQEVNVLTTDDELTALEPEHIETINEYIRKQSSYVFSITSEDIQALKNLFAIFNVPYIQSPTESEQTCCSLVNQGLCDAVLSNDTDCLAHRVNIFIYNLDTSKGDIKYIKKQDILDSLEFESENQLTDLGILVGCDYNRSRRLKNIGPVKAHQMIKECKNLETFRDKYKKDIDSINYKRCRELFNYELTKEEKIFFTSKKVVWKKPDLNEVKQYLQTASIFIEFGKIDKIFNREVKIIFNE